MTMHSLPSSARAEDRGEEGASIQAFLARYGPDEKLGLIPWDDLPESLANAAERFVADWWDSLDPDEPIRPSGLPEMTVAQLLQVWSARHEAHSKGRA